jgi:hypothetical protein
MTDTRTFTMKDTQLVYCPKCKAEAGTPCKGKGAQSYHMARHDLFRKIIMRDA